MAKIDLILLKYGEIALKGLNKPLFEQRLVENIKNRLGSLGKFSVKKAQSTIYVRPADESSPMEEAAEILKKIFGIVNICPAAKCEKNLEAIGELAAELMAELDGVSTFKVESKREDKTFPLKSPELSAKVGGIILSKVKEVKVDVHKPDVTVNVEIRDFAYVYAKKEKGAGGMPVGTNGRAALLLSGGIDSPVAGYMIAKRGVIIDAVHFHSHPYTSDRAKEKVIELANIMSEYCGKIRVHVVPFTDIQLEIIDKCPKQFLTVIMRRIMMRIAEKIASGRGCAALITGESIGQVASQTMESLVCTDAAVNMPVFRPLIGMDKEEIVTVSKKMGAYETSILPFEDCCTIFVPKHPTTKPKLSEIEEAEKALLNIDEMIEDAIGNVEIITAGR